jgi:hypothetical protein
MQISLQLTGFTSTPCHHSILWALTPLVSSFPKDFSQGSFVSVALSLGFPPVAVSDCYALYCPDFPLYIFIQDIGRSPNELPTNKYSKLNIKSPRVHFQRKIFPTVKGKVGARSTSPRRRTIRAPYLYDIQEIMCA